MSNISVQQPGLNVITELIIGYMYPGKPLANVAFKTYGYISMSQAIMFLGDFKLGHYMKIPPKSMFIVQVQNYNSQAFETAGTVDDQRTNSSVNLLCS